jgi:hypothetical protein
MKVFTFAIIVALVIMSGCLEKKNPAGSETSQDIVYRGTLYDSLLAVQFQNAGMNYTGSQYKYVLDPDSAYTVEVNVGMGWTSPPAEEGMYSINGNQYTFSPSINRRKPMGAGMTPVDTNKAEYAALLSGDTISIENFTNIDNKVNQRNLGLLLLVAE